MEITIRLEEDLQQRLDVRTAELGCTQSELVNRYILDGLMMDYKVNSPVTSLEEIKKLLKHDAPEGNGLEKIDGIFRMGDPTEQSD